MVSFDKRLGLSCQVVMLAMYNLSLEGTGRQGYFRWKEDICAFIGRHWNFLLGSRSLAAWNGASVPACPAFLVLLLPWRSLL